MIDHTATRRAFFGNLLLLHPSPAAPRSACRLALLCKTHFRHGRRDTGPADDDGLSRGGRSRNEQPEIPRYGVCDHMVREDVCSFLLSQRPFAADAFAAYCNGETVILIVLRSKLATLPPHETIVWCPKNPLLCMRDFVRGFREDARGSSWNQATHARTTPAPLRHTRQGLVLPRQLTAENTGRRT